MLCPALVIIDVAIKQLEKNSNVMTARLLLTMHGHPSALVEDCIQLMGVIQPAR